MLTPKLPTGQTSLAVVPQQVRIVLDEDSSRPLSFVLPPVDDLSEIEELRGATFSLEEHSEQRVAEANRAFADELGALRAKFGRFSSSPVYLHRLATLAEYAGVLDSEDLHRRAYELASSPFYAHRLGDQLATVDGIDAAEEFFTALGQRGDTGTNLRLASFAAQRQDFARAERFVRAALDVDPIDFGARLFDGGLSLFRLDYQQAIQSFRIALRERPTSSSAHCNLAIAYLGVRQEAKALTSACCCLGSIKFKRSVLAVRCRVPIEEGRGGSAKLAIFRPV